MIALDRGTIIGLIRAVDFSCVRVLYRGFSHRKIWKQKSKFNSCKCKPNETFYLDMQLDIIIIVIVVISHL